LSVRRIRRKRLTRSYAQRPALSPPNQEWAIDFASDVTANGRRLRVFSVVDAFTRECLALETDTSMPSQRVTRVLQSIIHQRGAPEFIRSDNGPEVSSRHYLAWCVERSIGTIHIQPGKPTQNGHVESFHGRFRTNVSMRVGSGTSGMHAARSPAGETNTTGNARIPRWGIEHRRSSHNSGRTPHRLQHSQLPLRRKRVKAKPFGRLRRP
jgi:transposase InsO family protein